MAAGRIDQVNGAMLRIVPRSVDAVKRRCKTFDQHTFTNENMNMPIRYRPVFRRTHLHHENTLLSDRFINGTRTIFESSAVEAHDIRDTKRSMTHIPVPEELHRKKGATIQPIMVGAKAQK